MFLWRVAQTQTADVREAVEGSAAAGGGLSDALAAEGLPTTTLATRLTPETCTSGDSVTWATALFPYMVVAAGTGVLVTACCTATVFMLLPCCGAGASGKRRRKRRAHGGAGKGHGDAEEAAIWANPMHGMSGRDLAARANATSSLAGSRSQLQQLRTKRASSDAEHAAVADAGATPAPAAPTKALTPEVRAARRQEQQQHELDQQASKDEAARKATITKKEFAPRFAPGSTRGGRRTRGGAGRSRGRGRRKRP